MPEPVVNLAAVEPLFAPHEARSAAAVLSGGVVLIPLHWQAGARLEHAASVPGSLHVRQPALKFAP